MIRSPASETRGRSRSLLGCLIRKDLVLLSRSRSILSSMVFPAVLVSVVLPLLLLRGGPLAGAPGTIGQWMGTFLARLPLTSEIAGLDPGQRFIYALAVYYFAPLFLLKAAAIGISLSATGIAGEIHDHTLETILLGPVSDRDLLASKIVATATPGVLATWLSFLLYCIVVNLMTLDVMGGVWFPPTLWLWLIFVLVPLVSILVVSLTMTLSLRLKHPADAIQLGNVVLFPLIGLFFSQAFGWLHFGPGLAAGLAVALAIIDGLLFIATARIWRRSRLTEEAL